MTKIKTEQEELTDWAIQHRRYLHQHPELSGEEYETCAYIKKHLIELKVELLTYEEPNVIGYIPGTIGEKTIALRADIDALPIIEEGNKPYISLKKGIAHVCGHDGHTSILLAVAKWIMENREQVKNNIVLIFQSSEEMSPSGAKKLVKEGVLESVDGVFGLHLMSTTEKGKIGVRAGEAMASSDDFLIRIQGKGGHAASPHETVDATYVAAHIIIALQSIISRKLDPVLPAVLSVGTVTSGSNTNIIPDHAEISGTFRTFSNETREQIMNEMRKLVENMCITFGASGNVQFIKGTPPVINNPIVTQKTKEILQKYMPERVFEIDHPVMSSEDFAFYLEKVPGTYLIVGMKGEKSQYPHHHPKFDLDEEELLTAIEMFIHIVTDYE